jgi:hypothetical protein
MILGLTDKYAWQERLGRDKYSRLFLLFISDEEKEVS